MNEYYMQFLSAKQEPGIMRAAFMRKIYGKERWD
jgi:hypothetical protein